MGVRGEVPAILPRGGPVDRTAGAAGCALPRRGRRGIQVSGPDGGPPTRRSEGTAIDDVLPGHHHEGRLRGGLRLAVERRATTRSTSAGRCTRSPRPGDRVFVALTSGSLSCSQSIVTLLRKDFDPGAGLAAAESMYEAARVVGDQVRRVADARPRGPRARRLQVQRQHHPRRPDPRPAARPLPDLPPGQPPPRHRGLAVPPDRRVQVRPADPRPGRPVRPDHASKTPRGTP